MAVTEYPMQTSKGESPGDSTFIISGFNPEIDDGLNRADIFPVPNTLWIPPTVAQTMDIESDDPGDAIAGDGMQIIKVVGIEDVTFNEISEFLEMNGGTIVPTVKEYIRINSMDPVQVGIEELNLGTITATATIDGTIQERMFARTSKSNSAIFTIPHVLEGKTSRVRAMLTSLTVGLNRNGQSANARVKIGIMCRLRIDTAFPIVVERQRFDIGIESNSPVPFHFDFPIEILPMTDLWLRALDCTDTNNDVSASFGGVLSEF